MIFTHVTPDEVAQVVANISFQRYGNNPVVEWVKNPRMGPNLLNKKGDRFQGRIVVWDSRSAGSRTSWSGRHGPWACWHVTRDVLQEVIFTYNARVTTRMARYTPETWYERYPDTGRRNIGSVMQPARMMDLCQCGQDIRGEAYQRPERAVLGQAPPPDPIRRPEAMVYDLQTSVQYLNTQLLGN